MWYAILAKVNEMYLGSDVLTINLNPSFSMIENGLISFVLKTPMHLMMPSALVSLSGAANR